MHPPLKTSDKKLEEEYEAVHRIFAAVQTTFELLCNRLLNLTIAHQNKCQESTIVSGGNFAIFPKVIQLLLGSQSAFCDFGEPPGDTVIEHHIQWHHHNRSADQIERHSKEKPS